MIKCVLDFLKILYKRTTNLLKNRMLMKNAKNAVDSEFFLLFILVLLAKKISIF
jgi:hypothetical protein